MLDYNSMNADQRRMCFRAMSVFSRWLNTHHEANGEDHRVTETHYFEFDDSPRLLLDNERADTYYRIAVFSFNPYHDEGGPNELTCYFDEPDLYLRHADQLFDTNIQPIYEDGKLVNEGRTEDETVLNREEA